MTLNEYEIEGISDYSDIMIIILFSFTSNISDIREEFLKGISLNLL